MLETGTASLDVLHLECFGVGGYEGDGFAHKDFIIISVKEWKAVHEVSLLHILTPVPALQTPNRLHLCGAQLEVKEVDVLFESRSSARLRDNYVPRCSPHLRAT